MADVLSLLPAVLATALASAVGPPPRPSGDDAASAATVLAAQAGTAATARQEVPMTRVVAGSASVILEAAHIVVVVVESVSASEALRLEVTVRDVLKGKPLATRGARVGITARRDAQGRRELQPRGPWAAAGPRPGDRLVVFSSAASSEAAAVLDESATLRVLPAASAENDVRRALALEHEGGTLPRHIGSVGEPPALSALFGEYMVARLGEDTLYADAAGWGRTMVWLEAPGRSSTLQMFVMQALTGKFIVQAAQAPVTDRLALCALRILGGTADEALAAQLVETVLPNLLGLEGASPLRPVAAVLDGEQGTKVRVLTALQRRPAGMARDRLLRWLAG